MEAYFLHMPFMIMMGQVKYLRAIILFQINVMIPDVNGASISSCNILRYRPFVIEWYLVPS